MSPFTLFAVLGEVAERKNLAMMRGGWNYTNRQIMLRNWEQYN